MKNLYIFLSKDDQTFEGFSSEARRMNLKIKFYRYENFSFEDDHLTYADHNFNPNFTEKDVILFKGCAYKKKRQHFWLRLLATLARDAGARVINEDFMVNFPLHRGKLFQAAYFSAKGIPHISTYRLSRKIKSSEYPMLIKKRYTSFGLDSKIINNEQELIEAKKQIKRLDDFVIQPFLKLDRDIRVLILNNKIVGAVKREVYIADDLHVGTKVLETYELKKEEKAIVDRVLDVFNLDMAGLDLFTSETGKTWLGEINFFPAFVGYTRVTGDNIFEKILLMMANSS